LSCLVGTAGFEPATP